MIAIENLFLQTIDVFLKKPCVSSVADLPKRRVCWPDSSLQLKYPRKARAVPVFHRPAEDIWLCRFFGRLLEGIRLV